MTDNRIRVARATDPERYLATDHTVWFSEVPAAPTEEQLIGLPGEQRFAADVDGSDPATYPGIYGVFPLTLSIPGPDAGVRQVPCAGLTWVGVHPDHRRKGVLGTMLRHHFEQVHEEQGTHVSALHASEPAIYARLCAQLPEELRDKESWRILFARRDGVDVGFAKFRRTHKWERARPAGELAVWALVGDPAAQLALLRRLVDLPEALQDRTWSAPCDLVVEVADPTAPWNDGSWRIRADAAGEATVERTEAESDLRLDGAVLAAARTGQRPGSASTSSCTRS
jgi:GNAT superfamily N-acetyltransferase